MEMIFENNVGDFKRWCDDIAQKQIPFAAAKALTDTAVKIATLAAAEASKKMTIRKKWAGTSKTARIGAFPNPSSSFFALPADKNKPMKRMFSIAGNQGWQMAQQIGENEIERKPLKAKTLWIPLDVKRSKANTPSVLLKRKGVFIRKTSKGLIMFQRKGKERALRPLYLLKKSQRIKPRYSFRYIAERRAERYFNFFFERAMKRAIETARI